MNFKNIFYYIYDILIIDYQLAKFDNNFEMKRVIIVIVQ